MRNFGRTDRQSIIARGAVGASLALLVFSPPIIAAPAQSPTPEATSQTSPPAAPMTTPPAPRAPNAPVAEPAAGATIGTAITEGASGPPGSKVMTLDQIVALAINNNTNVILAKQRLEKAQESITQVKAESRPQVDATVVDTYSSLNSFSTSGVSIATPSLPGGGQIPTVTDQGGGSTGSFVGGGGGGTANDSNAAFDQGLTTGATGYTGSTPTNTGAGTNNGAIAPGASSGTGSGSAVGGGSAGTTGGATASPQAMQAGLPPIMQKYAAATKTGVQSTPTGTVAATPHASANGNSQGGGSSGQHNNYAGRVSVTQYIDLFGLIPAALDVENITRDFYQLDLTRVQNETALSSKDFFFNVLLDQEDANVAQEQVNYAAENVRTSQAQFKAGTAAQFDVLTAQVTLANDQQALQTALNKLNIDRANLNNLIGVDPNTEITLKAPPLPPLNQPVDLKKSTATALSQRPELREAANNITIAKKLIKLAGASLQPSLGIGAGASYTGPTTTSNTSFDLSAQLNFPLYDGGATRSRVRQADTDLQTQLVTQSQLTQNVTLEVRQAYLDVKNAQNQASTAGVGVSQAEEAIRLAQLRKQNGLGTLLDVINAQAQLATARNNLASAQYDYQTSMAQLVRAEGGR